MILTMMKFELKNLIREKMTAFMLLYPLLLGLLGKYLVDQEIVHGQGVGLTVMFIALLAGFAYGAMVGFSLLDDRDDQVFSSIQIAPVSLNLYIWVKICFAYLLAIAAGFFIIWFTGAIEIDTGEILLISVLAALQTPITAFLVNSFAKNKVEGFITMKATGFLLLFPFAGFFFLDAKEWLFAIAPGHWAAKAVQFSLLQPQINAGFIEMNLSFNQYITFGILYNLLLVAFTYMIFKNKNDL